VLIGAEAGARLDDLYFQGTPFVATPSREYDLTQAEPWGLRGRTNGSYRKWKLNQFGFRGPAIDPVPPADTVRVVVLGSSESFGLYEDEGLEYPAQLDRTLRSGGRYEVVNASLAGMALNRVIPYWDNWVRRFESEVVLLYPNPIFYLREAPPVLETEPRAVEQPAAPGVDSRLAGRIVDSLRGMPIRLRKWNRERQLRAVLADKPADWVFETAPAERLALYRLHAAETVRRIRHAGARPVLVTYAIAAAYPPRPQDALLLEDMRTHFPRSTAQSLTELHARANDALRALARELDVPVVDADRCISGRSELFADLVHFNNRGAHEMARLLAEELTRLQPARVKATH
jgi:hypothetical protein